MTTFDFVQQLLPAVEVIAQAATPAYPNGPQQEQPLWTLFVFPAFMLAILYFVLFRPQSIQRKEMQKMIEESKIGDRVETSGGIVGTITNIRDKTFIIKTADQTKIELLKGYVNRVTREGKEASTSSPATSTQAASAKS
ncbi:preprotein translocase subunit YajC [Verrucomicrobia bacterium LW23]|nr:preprotein translocase subunit YajC [Verrucomicrobia bacterium LW23]